MIRENAVGVSTEDDVSCSRDREGRFMRGLWIALPFAIVLWGAVFSVF